MSAPYDDISTVANSTSDPTQLLVYANEITNEMFMPLVLFAFFLIVFLGSSFANIRFKGRARIDLSFTVAGFASFGFALLMMQRNGLLSPVYFWITLGVSIIGVAWIWLSSES